MLFHTTLLFFPLSSCLLLQTLNTYYSFQPPVLNVHLKLMSLHFHTTLHFPSVQEFLQLCRSNRNIDDNWKSWNSNKIILKSEGDNLSQTATSRGEGDGTPLQYSCLENPMDGGAWQAAVHGVTKSRTLTERLHFHALEKKMATHSSVLALRISGTGEPSGLPSLGLHRVGHD